MKITIRKKSDKMKMKRLQKSDTEYIRIKEERKSMAHGARIWRQFMKANKQR
ncbi:MAG: hypothetical protein ABII64_00605 [Elusimicrobiota bacterium]